MSYTVFGIFPNQEEYNEVITKLENAGFYDYTITQSEKQALETELNLTKYELEAYNELLLKIPQEKNKIILLHKKTSEKFFQLNGKLRAINQLMAIQ